jgi:hypothetical protein
MVVAAAVMGKEGFAGLKGRFFKKYGPPERVSLARYRVGLVMFVLPPLVAWLGPYTYTTICPASIRIPCGGTSEEI